MMIIEDRLNNNQNLPIFVHFLSLSQWLKDLVTVITGDMMQDLQGFLISQREQRQAHNRVDNTYYSGRCCGMNRGADYPGPPAEGGPQSL